MGPITSVRQRTVIAFVVLIFLAIAISLFLLNSNLGARNAAADNTQATTVYRANQQTAGFSLTPAGEVLGHNTYSANSVSAPYRVSGLKGLAELKFTASNLPTPASVELCVQTLSDATGSMRPLICDIYDLADTSSLEWGKTFPTPLLVGNNRDYFCTVSLTLPSQTAVSDLQVAGAQLGCELTFNPIAADGKALISLNGNLLNQAEVGPKLLPGLEVETTKPLRLSSIWARIGADQELDAQRFADICVFSGQTEVCTPSYESDKQVDSNFSAGQATANLDLPAGSKFTFNCRTQTGRFGNCKLFALFELKVSDLATTSVTTSDFFKMPSSSIPSYCSTALSYYRNHPVIARVASTDNKLSRCQAILSGSDF
jgi:hypothetical protein